MTLHIETRPSRALYPPDAQLPYWQAVHPAQTKRNAPKHQHQRGNGRFLLHSVQFFPCRITPLVFRTGGIQTITHIDLNVLCVIILGGMESTGR